MASLTLCMLGICEFNVTQVSGTVLPAKSDRDVMFCLQFLNKMLTPLSKMYTPLKLRRIERSLVY